MTKYNDNIDEIKEELYDYPDILTPREVMEILGISESLIYRLLNSGEIPSKKIGKKVWRIFKQQLLNYMLS